MFDLLIIPFCFAIINAEIEINIYQNDTMNSKDSIRKSNSTHFQANLIIETSTLSKEQLNREKCLRNVTELTAKNISNPNVQENNIKSQDKNSKDLNFLKNFMNEKNELINLLPQKYINSLSKKKDNALMKEKLVKYIQSKILQKSILLANNTKNTKDEFNIKNNINNHNGNQHIGDQSGLLDQQVHFSDKNNQFLDNQNIALVKQNQSLYRNYASSNNTLIHQNSTNKNNSMILARENNDYQLNEDIVEVSVTTRTKCWVGNGRDYNKWNILKCDYLLTYNTTISAGGFACLEAEYSIDGEKYVYRNCAYAVSSRYDPCERLVRGINSEHIDVISCELCFDDGCNLHRKTDFTKALLVLSALMFGTLLAINSAAYCISRTRV